MAIRMGRGWLIGGGALAALAMVLAWALYDGGESPLRPMQAPAMLPKVGS